MNQKIHLSLNEEELAKFRSLIDQSKIKSLQKLVSTVVDKEDQGAFIKRRVFEALSDLSGVDIAKIKVSDRLKNDLGLTFYHKKALKTYFQNILKELGLDRTITISECENLIKVEDCITLVTSKL